MMLQKYFFQLHCGYLMVFEGLNGRHFHKTTQASRDTKRSVISYTQVNECRRQLVKYSAQN